MGAAVDIPSVSRCGSIPATLGKRLACRAMDRSFQTETTQNISIRDNWQMMFETAAIGMMMMMMMMMVMMVVMMMMMRTVLSVHQSVLRPSHCHISPIVFLETSATAWCGSYVSANDVNDDNEVEAVEHVLLRPRCDR